jgi:hypothetical protein
VLVVGTQISEQRAYQGNERPNDTDRRSQMSLSLAYRELERRRPTRFQISVKPRVARFIFACRERGPKIGTLEADSRSRDVGYGEQERTAMLAASLSANDRPAAAVVAVRDELDELYAVGTAPKDSIARWAT